MFKNKYEADNSRFGEVLTQMLSAHGIEMLVKLSLRVLKALPARWRSSSSIEAKNANSFG